MDDGTVEIRIVMHFHPEWQPDEPWWPDNPTPGGVSNGEMLMSDMRKLLRRGDYPVSVLEIVRPRTLANGGKVSEIPINPTSQGG